MYNRENEIRQEGGQLGFSTLWNGYATDQDAKKARLELRRVLKNRGFYCKFWVLKNQLKKYASFGVIDGRSCDVYMINYYPVKKSENEGRI